MHRMLLHIKVGYWSLQDCTYGYANTKFILWHSKQSHATCCFGSVAEPTHFWLVLAWGLLNPCFSAQKVRLRNTVGISVRFTSVVEPKLVCGTESVIKYCDSGYTTSIDSAILISTRVAGAGHFLLFRLRLLENFGSGSYPYPYP